MNKNLPPPDKNGCGRAWHYSASNIATIAQGRTHSGISQWLIEAPWANPMWHNYLLVVFHLRLLPGFGAPKIYLPGATHELTLAAIDPGWEPASMDDNPCNHMLYSLNFAAQMICRGGDIEAARRIEVCVDDIMAGILSPDTDFSQQWIARFGSNMIKGDPSRVGETIIVHKQGDKTTKVVHDPKPADAVPDTKGKTP